MTMIWDGLETSKESFIGKEKRCKQCSILHRGTFRLYEDFCFNHSYVREVLFYSHPPSFSTLQQPCCNCGNGVVCSGFWLTFDTTGEPSSI